ncbi:hypothetical protein FOA52_003164 [Chlamydomonas sp. UWO 241]|nr:hypothetical protein FOA52_003164 [Chlamydomonas sp. UWO 241]
MLRMSLRATRPSSLGKPSSTSKLGFRCLSSGRALRVPPLLRATTDPSHGGAVQDDARLKRVKAGEEDVEQQMRAVTGMVIDMRAVQELHFEHMEELLSDILTVLQRLGGSERAPSHTPPVVVDQHVRSADTNTLTTVERLADSIGGAVGQLGSSSSGEREHAAKDLMSMAHDDNVAALAAEGAIPALVRLLGPRSSPEVQAAAALALGNLASDDAGNRAIIAAAGAIPALVQLLQDTGTSAGAAEALACLADGHAQNQADIAAAGAIPALVKLLQHNNSIGVGGCAASILGSLAAGHAQNQSAIAAAGAIPVLVYMRNDEHVCVQEAAARALHDLADDHARNQGAIAAATKKLYEHPRARPKSPRAPKRPAAPLSPLKASIAGKVFTITGTLQGHVRSEFEEHLENAGASVVERVAVDTTALIVTTRNPGKVKVDKAIQLGVPRMTEAEFWDTYGASA